MLVERHSNAHHEFDNWFGVLGTRRRHDDSSLAHPIPCSLNQPLGIDYYLPKASELAARATSIMKVFMVTSTPPWVLLMGARKK